MNKCYDFIREGMIRQSNGDGEAIRCECGNIIGVIDNGEFVFRHRGRKIVIEGDAKATIYCERCGAETEIISKNC